MSTEMPIEKLLSEIDKIQHINTKCYYDNCERPPINSHTIAENYLYKLSNRGLREVLTFEPAMTIVYKKPRVLKNVNKDKFSTFTGFCKEHDHKLFGLIDSYDGVMNNEKAALIHYRNICYGVNHIETNLLRLEHIAQQNYAGDSNKEINEVLKMIKDGTLLLRLKYCLSEHFHRKKQLERIIESGDFEKILFLSLDGSIDDPIFCGRSSYLLHKSHGLFNSHGYSYMPWITYMTLRTEKENHLIFCWLKSDKDYAKHLRGLLQGEKHRTIIAGLVWACSDAFAVTKSHYEKYSSTIEECIKLRSY